MFVIIRMERPRDEVAPFILPKISAATCGDGEVIICSQPNNLISNINILKSILFSMSNSRELSAKVSV